MSFASAVNARRAEPDIVTSKVNLDVVLQPENMRIPLQGHFGRQDSIFPVKVQLGCTAALCIADVFQCDVLSWEQGPSLSVGYKTRMLRSSGRK